jgi:uncharacterized protein (DUF952 family)
MTIIYRIIARNVWQAALTSGVFTGTAHDARDAETARKHYANQSDLLLLHVRTDTLDQQRPGALKWEPSRNDQLFPHLYADLPVSAVHKVELFDHDCSIYE